MTTKTMTMEMAAMAVVMTTTLGRATAACATRTTPAGGWRCAWRREAQGTSGEREWQGLGWGSRVLPTASGVLLYAVQRPYLGTPTSGPVAVGGGRQTACGTCDTWARGRTEATASLQSNLSHAAFTPSPASSPRVCQDGWDDRDAAVVCNQLGYAYGTAVRGATGGGSTPPGPQRMRIWLDEVACSGREQRLSMCATGRPLGQSDCSHRADAGVQCWDEEPDEPGVVPLSGAECECGESLGVLGVVSCGAEAWGGMRKGGRGAWMKQAGTEVVRGRRGYGCWAGWCVYCCS